MTDKTDIEKLIAEKPEFGELIFQRGFLITNDELDITTVDFCRDWISHKAGSFNIYVHRNTEYYAVSDNGIDYFLIGHAYNPFSKSFSEGKILRELVKAYECGREAYLDYLDGITGVYVIGIADGETLKYQTDASGMRASYWGIIDESAYITSHCNLICNIKGLKRDPYIDELINYRFYKFFGAGLPGDMSPFKELKRIQCNFEYVFDKNSAEYSRIYPREKAASETYDEQIEGICTILESNMQLISEKWGDKAALSLTGGRDSTTSLAGAHKLLKTLRTFSYVTCEGEKYDADAAAIIADKVGVSHEVINIELTDEENAECESICRIIEYNMGCIGRLKDRDVRRRVYFLHHPFYETEVKSWVDEIGRARLHKRYLKKHFSENIRPRYLTTIYKFFAFNRSLACKTDRAFKEYLYKYYSAEVFEIIPWWDLMYWEYSWAASEALHFANEHMFSANVTIPFNNRALLDKMLEVDLEKRIEDSIQIDVITSLLPEILETGIHVKDFGWNKKRELSERLYWEINTHLPF